MNKLIHFYSQIKIYNWNVLILVLSTVVLSCTKPSDKSLLSIANESRVMVHLQDTGAIAIDTIKASLIAERMEYIKLEKFDSTCIRRITKIMIDEDLLFVQADSRLLLFNSQGGFIREISSTNQQSGVWGFDLSKQENKIYIATARALQIFDYKGTYFSQIDLSTDHEGIGNFFGVLDSENIAIAVWNEGHNVDRLIMVDNKGAIVKTYPNHEKFNSPNTPMRNASRYHRSIYRYKDELRYHPLYSDTVFAISIDTIEPVFAESIVEKVPVHNRLEFTGNLHEFRKYCFKNKKHIHRTYESDQYWHITFQYAYLTQTFESYLLYNKTDSVLILHEPRPIYTSDVIHLGYFNDWDGGIAIKPDFICDNKILSCYGAKEFLKLNSIGYRIENCDNKDGVCKIEIYKAQSGISSRLNTELEREIILNDLNANDNPIIVILTLKP